MSDSGNIQTISGGHSIYFYTYWRGVELPSIVKRALTKGKPRWDDVPYLNRVIFQELLGGDNTTTGFGISHVEGDSDNPDVIVDHDRRTVTVGDDEPVSFANYIGQQSG